MVNEWTVKITDREDQRFLIKYQFNSNMVVHIGQYKLKGRPWIDVFTHAVEMNEGYDVVKIQEHLYYVYRNMNERIDNFNNLNDGYNAIEEIGIE